MVKQLKMKMLALLIFSFLLSCKSVSSFVNSNRAKVVPKSALFGVEGNNSSPLLVRAALGQSVERVPVWMMRQAGRHMKVGFYWHFSIELCLFYVSRLTEIYAKCMILFESAVKTYK